MTKLLARVAPAAPAEAKHEPAHDHHAHHDHAQHDLTASAAPTTSGAAAGPRRRRRRPVTAPVTHRRNIASLTEPELAQLREGFRRLQAITDDRGYQYFAGIHGLPLPVYCRHGDPLFAIWHRPYLYFLEKAFQDVMPGFALPYWDWASEQSQEEGLPPAYTVEAVDGVANPLVKSPISFSGSRFPETFRDPGDPSQLAGLADLVRRAQRTRTGYVDYSRNLENPHNGVHGWVGGTMGSVGYAAYDPIFWAHHANIDRLFAEWQVAHRQDQPPADIADVVLQPFNVTVRQVWNIRNLGYDYVAGTGVPVADLTASAEESVKLNGPIATFRSSDLKPTIATSATAATFAADITTGGGPTTTAYIKLHGLEHPRDSFEVRVFLNEPDANAGTQTLGNPRFAGSIHLFGHGDCAGEEGHCDPASAERGAFDLRPPHHLTPMTVQIDASEAVAAVASESDEITVSVVAVDRKGNVIEDPGIEFESLSIDVV